MMDMQADAVARGRVYQRLALRNRVVGALRIGVPVLGVLALGVMGMQIAWAGLVREAGVGAITVSSDTIRVDTPEYAGVLGDGTTYRVSARGAEAAMSAAEQIALRDAALTTARPDGYRMEIAAPEALLDTATETVVVAGAANVRNSAGTTGVLRDTVFDYPDQRLVGNGPVTIDYADGTHLVAEGMTYDAARLVWTFTRATVTLPSTPGAKSDP